MTTEELREIAKERTIENALRNHKHCEDCGATILPGDEGQELVRELTEALSDLHIETPGCTDERFCPVCFAARVQIDLSIVAALYTENADLLHRWSKYIY